MKFGFEIAQSCTKGKFKKKLDGEMQYAIWTAINREMSSGETGTKEKARAIFNDPVKRAEFKEKAGSLLPADYDSQEKQLEKLKKLTKKYTLLIAIAMIIITAYMDGAFIMHKVVDNTTLYFSGSNWQKPFVMIGLLSPFILIILLLFFVVFRLWAVRKEKKWDGKRDMSTGLSLEAMNESIEAGVKKLRQEQDIESLESAAESQVKQAEQRKLDKLRSEAQDGAVKVALDEAKAARKVISDVKKEKKKAKKEKRDAKYDELAFQEAKKVPQPTRLTPDRLNKIARGFAIFAAIVFIIVTLYGLYVKFIQGLPAAFSGKFETDLKLALAIIDILFILVSIILLPISLADPSL